MTRFFRKRPFLAGGVSARWYWTLTSWTYRFPVLARKLPVLAKDLPLSEEPRQMLVGLLGASRRCWRVDAAAVLIFFTGSPVSSKDREQPTSWFSRAFTHSLANSANPVCLAGPLELCLTISVRGFYRSYKPASLQPVRKRERALIQAIGACENTEGQGESMFRRLRRDVAAIRTSPACCPARS
jgi:hypothetical protein